MDALEIKFWFDEISSSEKRKQEELIKRNYYPALIQYYEGQPAYEQVGEKKQVMIQNEYFPNTHALRSEIVYQLPEVSVEATRPFAERTTFNQETMMSEPINNEQNAPIMQSAISHLWKKLDGLDENRLGFFDMLYAGFSAIEVAYVAYVAYKPPKPYTPEPNFLEKLGDKIKSTLSGEEIDKERAKEEPTQEETYAYKNEYILRRWNPLYVGFDYRAERIKDIRFAYKIIKKTYSEFVIEFPETERRVTAGEDVPYSVHQNPDNRKLVTYYEVQERLADGQYRIFAICPGFKEKELYEYIRPYKTDGFNMVIDVLDEYGVLYPKSRAAIAKVNQDEINDYIKFKKDVAERNIPKRGYDKRKVKAIDALQALKSNVINALVECEGGPESTWEIPSTKVSSDNNEMLMILERTKEKLWGVSGQKLQTGTRPDFAKELEIQEAGFQGMMIDMQYGLHRSMRRQVNIIKDIIATYWDSAEFFRITGKDKPDWYVPQMGPNGEVLNPLNEMLTADYECDVDIISAMKPNKERKRKEVIEYLTWVVTNLVPILPPGKMINFEVLLKPAQDFGLNPDNLVIDVPIPDMAAGMPGQMPVGMPPVGAEMPQGEALPQGAMI